MAINFDTLPGNNPMGQLIPEGTYFATIDKAEMKAPKNDPSKPDYLNLQYTITDANGKSYGKLFDMLTESDSDVVRYKLKRFITALEIPITGTFNLKDLTKIIVGKRFIVDITIQSDKNRQYADKSVVDVFKNEIYYPLSEATAIFGTVTPDASEPEIKASDAVDAPENQAPTSEDSEY